VQTAKEDDWMEYVGCRNWLLHEILLLTNTNASTAIES